MAWITKDVANQKIERRPEPYLSEALKQTLEAEVVGRYATRQAALLPVCHAVQHEHGWLPAQALEEIAEYLGLTRAEVLDAVTFYEELHLQPCGRHLVQICHSISCELCGCGQLSERIRAKLGIWPGETTDDGRYTLMELECIGACELAPAVLIDGRLHGPLTAEQLERMLDELEG